MSTSFLASSPLAMSGVPASRGALWAGRILTGIAVAFLLFDLGMKFVAPKEAVEGTIALGWQLHHMRILGVVQAVCLILYLVPRTAPLGAVLLTGYFGGAVASHLRLDQPLLSHTLFPVCVAAFLWVGLYLRDARVRALLRRQPADR